jgi:hypothetical protein
MASTGQIGIHKLGTMGKAAAASVLVPPVLRAAILPARSVGRGASQRRGGVDRVVVLPGKTYLRAWAGYGDPPRPAPRRAAAVDSTPPAPAGPPPTVRWSKKSGPGRVTFADPAALITAATLSEPGVYFLELVARDNSGATASSTLKVKVETPPPAKQLDVVHMRKWSIDSTLWNHRMKALTVSWIPHCIEQLERTDIAAGGLDNFIEAGKKLRGEPHGQHKGYVFANAYVHNAVEAMSIALMLDAKGDAEIERGQANMRATLDKWSDHPRRAGTSSYMQWRSRCCAHNARQPGARPFDHWERRADEGYTAGYSRAAIAHYMMTERKARCIRQPGSSPTVGATTRSPQKGWYDGHQRGRLPWRPRVLRQRRRRRWKGRQVHPARQVSARQSLSRRAPRSPRA